MKLMHGSDLPLADAPGKISAIPRTKVTERRLITTPPSRPRCQSTFRILRQSLLSYIHRDRRCRRGKHHSQKKRYDKQKRTKTKTLPRTSGITPRPGALLRLPAGLWRVPRACVRSWRQPFDQLDVALERVAFDADNGRFRNGWRLFPVNLHNWSGVNVEGERIVCGVESSGGYGVANGFESFQGREADLPNLAK